MNGSIQQSRMLVMLLLAGGLILLALVAADLEGDLPNFPIGAAADSSPEPLPMENMTNVFNVQGIPGGAQTNRPVELFAASYFKPPKKDPPKKSDPAPTSRKLPVLYQGMIENSQGQRIAFIELEGRRLSLQTNSSLAGDWTIRSIEPAHLDLALPSGETNRVPFRGRGTIEIPNP